MITVVGWDGSALDPKALQALQNSTFVTGGRRHLDALPVPPGARTVVMGNVEHALDDLARHEGPAVVLASGDPGFFGIVRALQERALTYTVIPAVSSVAAAFARAGIAWDDALVVSAHGRDLRPVLNACRAFPKVAVLTGPETGPGELAVGLRGVPRRIVVAERLGMPDERVSSFDSASHLQETREWESPSVVLVLDLHAHPRLTSAVRRRVAAPLPWASAPAAAPDGWALPEDAFQHRDGMITKSDVRALVLPRLAPRLGTLVWDIGAGSGSVGIECARFGAAVVAVERNAQQCSRIRSNAAQHGVDVQAVCASALDVLDGLPEPDAVFLGGGGLAVAEAVVARRPARVVAALAALDRLAPLRDLLAGGGYSVEGAMVSVSRLSPLPDGSSRLAAENPVLVLSGVLS